LCDGNPDAARLYVQKVGTFGSTAKQEMNMTSRFHTSVAIAALLAATLTSAAFAQNGPGGPGGQGEMLLEMFDTIDADKDGKVTKDEMDAHRAAEFAAADTNSDGVLSAEELTQKHLARMAETVAERTARMIENLDDNADGSLSAEEMDPRMQDRRFSRMDQDNDGAISKAEVEAAMEHFAHGRKKHGQGGMDDMGGMMEN
jgi:Ca2+-binding EF-hand superfamily protein